jgi:4-hydroxybenzoate polyprenyltransferase
LTERAQNKVTEKGKTFLELVRFEHSIFALPYAYIGALYGAVAAALGGVGWADYLSQGLFRPFGTRLAAASTSIDSQWVHVVHLPWFQQGRVVVLPTWGAVLWITVAMVGARSFAFVVNRAVDAEIDARNPRTAGRAIPAGRIKRWELWVFAIGVLVAYLIAVWQLAPVTRWLWPIPIAAFVIYPYTKRYSWLCHYWLGLCLGLAPVGAWAAVGAPLAHPAPWVLAAAVLLWTAGFDIIYATQDYECDVRDGVHSAPADFGIAGALKQTRVDHVATVVLLVVGGYLAGAGGWWYIGVAAAAALLAYENAIVSAQDLSRVNAAFFTVNGVIAIVVFGGALLDRVWP